MPDQTPELDVEAIRARLDATSPGMTVDVHDGGSTLRATGNTTDRAGFVGSIGDLVETFTGGNLGPVTATFVDDEDGQDATFALHAAADIRDLLDENARLNAELESLQVHNGVLVKEIYHQAARADAFREERDALVVQHQADLAARRTAEEHLRRDVVEIDEEREALAAKLEATAETWRPAETAWFATIRDEKDIALAKEHCKLMRQALGVAPEMPRPPAEEAPTEYMVVVPSIIGSLEDWRTDYRTDGVRKSTRDEAIAHGLEAEGHDDWLIAIVVGDKLTGLAWQHEDRDDAEEIAEAAEALGLAVPEAANGTAQSPSSGPETPGTGSGRGTGVAEASETTQDGEDA